MLSAGYTVIAPLGHYGIRIAGEQWLARRPSGTDPYIGQGVLCEVVCFEGSQSFWDRAAGHLPRMLLLI